MINVSIQQEELIFVNIYASNTGTPTYIKEILTFLKEEINNNTIIVGEFNTPFSIMNTSFTQKINKETLDLNYTVEQMDLIDI